MKNDEPNNLILLSILIPTVNGRERFFEHITRKLTKQINQVGSDLVQLLFYKDRKGEHTTGYKRNVLIQNAKGKFVVFVDDDDDVSQDYVKSIVDKIALNPDLDAIGINGIYTSNGVQTPFETGARWNWEMTNGYYTRFINHISPVKRAHALKIKFPDTTIGEDYDWTMNLKKSGLIKESETIKKSIYYYDYRANKND